MRVTEEAPWHSLPQQPCYEEPPKAIPSFIPSLGIQTPPENGWTHCVDLSRSKIMYLKAEKSSDMISTNDLINSLLSKRAATSLPLNMLLKNILATVAVVGLAAASPVEDLEARTGNYCEQKSNAWCCTTAFPFSAFFIQKVGSGCEHPYGGGPYYECKNPKKSNFLCCEKHQINDAKGGVVCTA